MRVILTITLKMRRALFGVLISAGSATTAAATPPLEAGYAD